MERTATPPLAAAAVVRDVRAGRGEPWVNTALRTRAAALRDILASDVAPGCTAEQLRDAVLGDDVGPVTGAARRSAVSLAIIWGASGADLASLVAAHRLLRSLRADVVFTPIQQQIFAQVAYLLGDVTDVQWAVENFRQIPAPVRQGLRTDLLNPVHGQPDVTRWHDALSEPFVTAGLSPVSVVVGHATAFDGLQSPLTDEVDGPLVSVIMPCYRPDAALLTSVRSILDQTYPNLEVLLVDDASGPDYAELFARCAAMDARVHLHRMASNGGTYLARNAGLREARGEFITVQDADDWSHPSRLAEQVRVLRDRPGAGGSRSDAIRATDDLTHQWVGYSPRRRNASSLMFPRSVLERTGPFDAVRKGADSEFHERLTILGGPVVDTRTPLAITRLRSGTLSRGDFSFRWMSPDRRLYRAAYRSWHRELRQDRSAVPVVGEVSRRPFPVPASFVRGLETHPSAAVDVLLVLDGSAAATCTRALDLVAGRPDLRFAVLHLEDPTRGRPHQVEPGDGLLRAARAGALSMVSPHEQIGADLVAVLTPGVLELPAVPAPDLAANRIVVGAVPPTVEGDVMDFVAAADGARALAGQWPAWCALDEAAQRSWGEAGWHLPLIAETCPPPHDDEAETR